MLHHLTHRPLWVNLLAAFTLFCLLGFTTIQLLGWVTKHGESKTVPSVIGKKTSKAISILKAKGFDIVIIDSVYKEKSKKGIVLKQLPDAKSNVKNNRKIYLVVNRTTVPKILMPELEGKTFSFAVDIIRRSNFKLGDTIYKPHFMFGAVIEQRYKGKRVIPGKELPYGSKIDLVIGGGLDAKQIPVPKLIDLTFKEAKNILEQQGISIGGLVATGIKDTLNAYVEWQSPPQLTTENEQVYIQAGQLMDIKLSKKKQEVKEKAEVEVKKEVKAEVKVKAKKG